MWSIVFPGRPPPTSIYVDSDQSEDFCLIREFSQRDGVSILREELEANGLLVRQGVSDAAVQEVLRVGMDSMFEYFRLNRRIVSSGDSSSGAQRGSAQTMHWGTPAENIADGDVARSTASPNLAQPDLHTTTPEQNPSGSASEPFRTVAMEQDAGGLSSLINASSTTISLVHHEDSAATQVAQVAQGSASQGIFHEQPLLEITHTVIPFGLDSFGFDAEASELDVPSRSFYREDVFGGNADHISPGHGLPTDVGLSPEPVNLDMLIGEITEIDHRSREWEWLTMTL
jgi:hypothetical protein